MILRRSLLALLLAMPTLAHAQASPTAPVAALNEGIIEVMKAGKTASFAQRMATLTPIVQKSFDLPLILKNSVGPARWGSISEAQRGELLDVFTQFTVGSYVANFDAFNGEKFVVAPDLRKVGKDVIVPTRIVPTAGDPTRLDYVMRDDAGDWRVVDVLLDGSISRVAVTRSDYRALLAGGDAGNLIQSLRSKVANLAAGAPP